MRYGRGELTAAYHQGVLVPTGQIYADAGTVEAEPVLEQPPLEEPGTAVFLPGPAYPSQRHSDIRRHRLARRVTSTCPMVTYLLLPVVAYQLTGSSGWPALALAVGCLPHLLTPMLTRAVPARLDRRRLIVAIDATNTAVLASVPVTFATNALSVPHLLVTAFAAQLLFVCHEAAYAAIAPYRPNRERPGTPLFGGGPTALAAPIVASVLLVFTAVPPLLTVDGISLVAAVVLVRALAAPSEVQVAPLIPRPRPAAGLGRRLTARLRQRVDLSHAAICGLYAAAGGAFMGQFVPWLNQDLGVRRVQDVRLGLLLAAWAGGAWLAPAVLSWLANGLAGTGLLSPTAADRLVATGVLAQADADRLVTGNGVTRSSAILAVPRRVIARLGGYRVTLVALPISGLLLLGTVLAGHWIVAAVLLAAWGTGYLVVVLDARVGESGLRMLAFGLGWPAGAVLGGVISGMANLGPRLGIACGVLAIVAAAAVGWWSPLRTADRPAPAS